MAKNTESLNAETRNARRDSSHAADKSFCFKKEENQISSDGFSRAPPDQDRFNLIRN